MRLHRHALDQLRAANFTAAAWTQQHFGITATTWRGDACGCPDDRCIGFHHATWEDCRCLPALLSR